MGSEHLDFILCVRKPFQHLNWPPPSPFKESMTTHVHRRKKEPKNMVKRQEEMMVTSAALPHPFPLFHSYLAETVDEI